MSQLYSRIFAAIDGSSTQDIVIERAIALAKAHHAELMFGHVVDVLPSDANGINYKMLAAEEEAVMRERLAPVFARIEADDDIPGCTFSLKVGRVGETLMEELVKPYDPDLVVCGERGFSDIKYAFVGSVSKYLIRESRCDVLVVKAEKFFATAARRSGRSRRRAAVSRSPAAWGARAAWGRKALPPREKRRKDSRER